MMLAVLGDAVDDRSVGAGVQEDPLVFVSDVVHRKRTVPSELPRHRLEDKGETSETPQSVRSGAATPGAPGTSYSEAAKQLCRKGNYLVCVFGPCTPRRVQDKETKFPW